MKQITASLVHTFSQRTLASQGKEAEHQVVLFLSGDPLKQALDDPIVVSLTQRRHSQRHALVENPHCRVAHVVRLVVENGEPLRRVAEDYGGA